MCAGDHLHTKYPFSLPSILHIKYQHILEYHAPEYTPVYKPQFQISHSELWQLRFSDYLTWDCYIFHSLPAAYSPVFHSVITNSWSESPPKPLTIRPVLWCVQLTVLERMENQNICRREWGGRCEYLNSKFLCTNASWWLGWKKFFYVGCTRKNIKKTANVLFR